MSRWAVQFTNDVLSEMAVYLEKLMSYILIWHDQLPFRPFKIHFSNFRIMTKSKTI